MKTRIGISEENKQEVSNLLNTLLADETVLSIKTRNYHWNVKGPNFFGLYNLLELQYEQLNTMVDNIAERTRQLGHFAFGTMEDYLMLTRLKECKHENVAYNQMLVNLIKDHESLIRILRNNILKSELFMDLVTADFISGLAEKHEKMVWMLRSSTEADSN